MSTSGDVQYIGGISFLTRENFGDFIDRGSPYHCIWPSVLRAQVNVLFKVFFKTFAT